MDWNSMYGKDTRPDMGQIAGYVGNTLWLEFYERMKELYQIEPSIEYSSCSMQPGWNVKYKKSSKALCTLYPKEGVFLALIVIGSKEITEAELLMPLCSAYVQKVFSEAEAGTGQKWLMLEVSSMEVLEDLVSLVKIRKPVKVRK